MSKTEIEYVGVKISRKLKNNITDAIKRGEYVSQSDLVRDALRRLFDQGEQ
jgi:Arc/MetJ-type ribon-helix-helix transcriptional regulator